MRQRLQKILAQAGYGSRRAAESLITGGHVRVNGEISSRLGTQADPDVDRIEVDGEVIVPDTAPVYLAMHKARGYVTTASDTHGRRTVMDLLPDGVPPHVLPVGRLDRDTEGLLFFTNDGELAHRLTHPRYEIDKEYHALVDGTPSAEALSTLKRGVEIDGKLTSPATAELVDAPQGYDAREGYSWVRIVIHEGRKRQVRRMFEAVGHRVRVLLRTRVGGVELGATEPGQTRSLTDDEVASLRRAVGLDT